MNEMIEDFYIKHGGAPIAKEDLHYYYTDWGALMAVIGKAKQVAEESDWNNALKKEARSGMNAVFNEVCNINIKAAHLCLVRFIDWYNQIEP